MEKRCFFRVTPRDKWKLAVKAHMVELEHAKKRSRRNWNNARHGRGKKRSRKFPFFFTCISASFPSLEKKGILQKHMQKSCLCFLHFRPCVLPYFEPSQRIFPKVEHSTFCTAHTCVCMWNIKLLDWLSITKVLHVRSFNAEEEERD